MKATSTERYILCGGYGPRKLEAKKEPIHLDLWGRNANVTLKISDISKRMVSNVPSIFVDLLEIATYVYCADQAVTRGGDGTRDLGARWRRRFKFHIPVRNLRIWSSPKVREILEDTLGFLSDDQYEFTFVKLLKPPSSELYFDFGTGPGTEFSVDEVLLFSGGLDSISGAVQETIVGNHNVALVSHRSTPKVATYQRSLAKELTRRCKTGVRPFHIPVWINKQKYLSRDFNQRTRSFLYACLAATVASIFKLSRIRFYENGIVSFNLPISAQVIGARATRVTHPRVLNGFAELFSLLTKKEFEVDNPFLWKTKAEVVQLVDKAGCADLIKHTVSCSRVYGRTKMHTHCGTCSQCIDRRFGTLAAGCAADDPVEMYKTNLLVDELKAGKERTMVESYVRTASEIEDMSDIDFFSHFGETNQAWPYLEGSVHDNAQNLLDLHQRHSREVLGVLDKAVGDHAAEIRKGTLPDSCLLVLNLPVKYRTLYRPPGREPVFCKEGEYWCLCFDGKNAYLKDCRGLGHICCLLRSPNKPIHAAELRATGTDDALPLLGSAGEAADLKAIHAYKSRQTALQGKLEEAKADGDLARQEAIIKEMEFLEQELSRSTGLGGRSRKVSDDSDRARKAVSAAISRAMVAIQKEHPPLWQHLQQSLRKGTYPTYTPGRPIYWQT
ncbi:MAG: 7-cyano-7-deazaguanine synthase [Candidatus Zixiibacteriota bacterium]